MVCFLALQSLVLPFEDSLANYFDLALIIVTTLCYFGYDTLIAVESSPLQDGISMAFELALILAYVSLHTAVIGVHIHRQFPSLRLALGSLYASAADKLKNKKKEEAVTSTVVQMDDGEDSIAERNDETPLSSYNMVGNHTISSFHGVSSSFRAISASFHRTGRLQSVPYRDSIFDSMSAEEREQSI